MSWQDLNTAVNDRRARKPLFQLNYIAATMKTTYDGVERQTIGLGIDSGFLVDCIECFMRRATILSIVTHLSLSWRYRSMDTHPSVAEGPRVLVGFPVRF